MVKSAEIKNGFARDGGENFGWAGIVPAGEREVLPDQDAARVTGVVKVGVLVDTTTPYSTKETVSEHIPREFKETYLINV